MKVPNILMIVNNYFGFKNEVCNKKSSIMHNNFALAELAKAVSGTLIGFIKQSLPEMKETSDSYFYGDLKQLALKIYILISIFRIRLSEYLPSIRWFVICMPSQCIVHGSSFQSNGPIFSENINKVALYSAPLSNTFNNNLQVLTPFIKPL